MKIAEPAHPPEPAYDMDYMLEALVQGRGEWVSSKTLPLAQAGLAKAQLMMGILHQLGIGVPQNGAQAVTWYRAAAAQHDALAWKNLGTLYLLGLAGVPVDKHEAHRCFLRARELELIQAASHLRPDEVVH